MRLLHTVKSWSTVCGLALSVVACAGSPDDEAEPGIITEAWHGSTGSAVGGDDEETDGSSTGSSGSAAESDGSESSGGFDPSGGGFAAFPDLGAPVTPDTAYACGDPTANIPEGVRCEDAVPGNEAPEKIRDAVAQAFGDGCWLERTCGDMRGVDCGAASDGFYYYVSATMEVVSTCGGACMTGACDNCPPDGWVCPMY